MFTLCNTFAIFKLATLVHNIVLVQQKWCSSYCHWSVHVFENWKRIQVCTWTVLKSSVTEKIETFRQSTFNKTVVGTRSTDFVSNRKFIDHNIFIHCKKMCIKL